MHVHPLNESTSVEEYMKNAENSVDKFFNEVEFRVDRDEFMYSLKKGLEFFSYSSNNWRLDIDHNPNYQVYEKKNLEETYYSEFVQYIDVNLKSMFDIIVLTGNSSDNVDYLNDWRPMIEGINCIIIQQGNPDRDIRVPEWVTYELYSKTEMIKLFPNDMWLFDADSNDLSAYNFGFLIADREFVYLLHPNVIPIFIEGRDPLELLRIHALNLLKPSHYNYWNNGVDPSHNPDSKDYLQGSDFVKGFPYNLRDGIITGISFGTIQHEYHQDTLTKFSKLSFGTYQSSPHSFLRQQKSISTYPISQPIPKGMMFSLSLYNLAFHRGNIGQIFFLYSHLGTKTKFDYGDYYHILLGWLLKALFDHIGVGIKHHDSSQYLRLRNLPAQGIDLKKQLTQDLLWLERSDQIMKHLTTVELCRYKDTDYRFKYNELFGAISPSFKETFFLQNFHTEMKNSFLLFNDLFNIRNGFDTIITPVSKKNSYLPKNDPNYPYTKHNVATFTIIRNDTQMLEIWLRHSNRHFHKDIYVMIHYSTEAEYHADVMNHQRIKELQSKYFFHVFYGFDNAGFPMYYFVKMADIIQRRLFRYGYSATMLTDVDEIIVPDPDIYPNEGLTEYLISFMNNKDVLNIRARGFMLCQIYEVDGGHLVNDPHIDKDLDWSKNLFEQRSYWYPQEQYNKPILAKIPVREKPGFHHLYHPMRVLVEHNLYLFHLREVDRNFCLQREERKYSLIKKAFQSEINLALNHHLVSFEKRKAKGEVCQFAQGVYSEKFHKVMDNTGRITLEKMDDKWKKVVV